MLQQQMFPSRHHTKDHTHIAYALCLSKLDALGARKTTSLFWYMVGTCKRDICDRDRSVYLPLRRCSSKPAGARVPVVGAGSEREAAIRTASVMSAGHERNSECLTPQPYTCAPAKREGSLIILGESCWALPLPWASVTGRMVRGIAAVCCCLVHPIAVAHLCGSKR